MRYLSRANFLGFFSVLVSALWVGPTSAWAESPVIQMEVSTPRSFGYVIGDTIEQEIRLEVADSHALDETTLPEEGRLTYWLELRPPLIRSRRGRHSTLYEIALTYQIFNVPDALSSVAMPGYELSVVGPGDAFPVFVPEWVFTVSPITRGAESGGLLDLRSARAPALVSVEARVERVIWLSVGLLIALALLVQAYWGFPLATRRGRPFTRAVGQLKRLERRPAGEALHRDALRHVHEAFNQTAGEVVFAENIDGFLAQHIEFAPLREQIEAFFAVSRRVFFTGSSTQKYRASLDKMTQLCRACRELERGIP